jgi:hypothetical protein
VCSLFVRTGRATDLEEADDGLEREHAVAAAELEHVICLELVLVRAAEQHEHRLARRGCGSHAQY